MILTSNIKDFDLLSETVYMRCFLTWFAGLLFFVPGGALAQDGSVSLRPGEQAVVSFDGSNRSQVTVVRLSQEQQLGSIEWMMQRRDAAGSGEGSQVQAVAPNVLRITFLDLRPFSGSDERLLLVENGYDHALRYRAVMVQGEGNVPTSVCTVFPMLRGVEHWPHPVDRIDLSSLTLVPYREGDSIVCE